MATRKHIPDQTITRLFIMQSKLTKIRELAGPACEDQQCHHRFCQIARTAAD